MITRLVVQRRLLRGTLSYISPRGEMTIPLIAKRKRSKAADVSPLMTTNSSFERESLSFSFSRRRRTVIPRCLLAASCEITVQISPWQSGSYSASLYSRLSRSSLVSASSLSPRITLLSISPLCAVRSATTFFPRGAEPTSWGRQSDSGQRLCSIREISKERRSTSVLHARNGERRIHGPMSLHEDNHDVSWHPPLLHLSGLELIILLSLQS